MTVEEWVKELDNLPCMICGGNTEDDDELLMLCDLCNKGIEILFKTKVSILFVWVLLKFQMMLGFVINAYKS